MKRFRFEASPPRWDFDFIFFFFFLKKETDEDSEVERLQLNKKLCGLVKWSV